MMGICLDAQVFLLIWYLLPPSNWFAPDRPGSFALVACLVTACIAAGWVQNRCSIDLFCPLESLLQRGHSVQSATTNLTVTAGQVPPRTKTPKAMRGNALRRASSTNTRCCTRVSEHKYPSDETELPELDRDEFMMYDVKVIPCPKTYCHEWSECPFAHRGEKAARRDLRTFHYTGVVCPDMKKNASCPRGNHCPFAHSVFEYGLHPTRFRTVLCSEGVKCTRTFCFFAHSPEELREPEVANLGKPEGTAQDAMPKTAIMDTASVDKATDTVSRQPSGVFAGQHETFKETQQVAQGSSLSANDQQTPAPEGRPSDYDAMLLPSAAKRCSEARDGGATDCDRCSCGCGTDTSTGTTGDSGNPEGWQGDHMGLVPGFDPALTQHQLDVYLAGLAYALGQRVGATWLMPQEPSAPLSSEGWGAELLYLQQHAERWVADVCSRQTAHRPHELWMGNAEDCSPAIAHANPLLLSNQPKCTSPSAPATCTKCNPRPSNPFNATWEAKQLPSDFDRAFHQAQQPGALLNWDAASPNRSPLEAAGYDSTDAPRLEQLDPVVNFPCSSLLTQAAPFDHLGGLHKIASMQSDQYPQYSLF
ncbi:g5197 [Coccomyxa elongata]